MDPQHPNQKCFSAKEVAAILGIERRTFIERVRRGVYPRGIQRSKREWIWSDEDVKGMLWYEANKHRYRASKRFRKTNLPGS